MQNVKIKMKNYNFKIKNLNAYPERVQPRLRQSESTLGQGFSNGGFTLLETLIGISILVAVLTVTFTVVQSSLSSSVESKNQVTAFFLAQEAVEYIRNVRDSNVLSGGSGNWLADLGSCYPNTACTLDATKGPATAFSNCSINNCPNIRQDLNGASATYGMYGYDSSWTSTLFNREIQIQVVVPNQEIILTVIMKWQKGTSPQRTFTVRESIFNWQ